MPSKESLGRAREWLDTNIPVDGSHTADSLADLLDEAIREAALTEAECWFTNWNVDDSIRSFETWAKARIAQLREGKP